MAGIARAEIRTRVENAADDHRLRVHFAWDLPDSRGAHIAAPAVLYDGHFDLVARPGKPASEDGTWVERWRPECPQRTFTDLSAPGRGLMAANRGLPEVEVVDGREIALTLLRCVGWLSRDDFPARRMHAGPMLPIPGAQMHGRWEFEYALIQHAGDLQAAMPEARSYEAPFRAIETGAHAGALPVEGAFLEVAPSGFEVTAVKPAEDGRGLIVRGWNATNAPLRVRVRSWRAFRRAELVNLAEVTLAALPLDRRGAAAVSVPPHGIATIRFNG
jgi:alpha-mannosidase